MGKLDLYNCSVVELYEVTQTFAMVDYVMEMTSMKSCKYGEYGLFEHLPFLFLICVCVRIIHLNFMKVSSVHVNYQW